MIKDTEIDTDPGRRDPEEDRKRLLFGLLLLVLMVTIELTVGRQIDEQNPERSSGEAQAVKQTVNTIDTVPGDNASTRKRILYISNSHAKTGGYVAKHLQALLDELQPGHYEVTDSSAPGIFAPDMLQRVLLGLENDPDVVIMAVAYISLSDRMKLALQAHSARSFFKPGVFKRLSAGFWLRNYDIGLYLETFLKQHLHIFHYRNKLRDLWEQPVVNTLKATFDKRPILFLEVDEDQKWKFPEGYDRNLFDWRLYSAGRQGHLADLAEAIESATDNGVPVIGMNLPIHWEKSLRTHKEQDYRRYREEIANSFAGALDYVDYQDNFPVEFTAYDALHPTWHGARLHALDTVLRLQRKGIVDDMRTPAEIAQVFSSMDMAVSEDYQASLNDDYEVLDRQEFKRYDIFEPDNAHKLMRHLASLPVGSQQESNHLYQLSIRLRYWQETDFTVPSVDPDTAYSAAFKAAARNEIIRARQRANFFQQRLAEFQGNRLSWAPLPVIESDAKVSVSEIPTKLGLSLYRSYYRLEENREAISFELPDGRIFAKGIQNDKKNPDYLRIDILGDHSYLLIQPTTGSLTLPTWIRHTKPFVKFGI